jgi:hypothetical protein
MNFFDYNATRAWITDTEIHVQISDGRVGKLPIANFSLLANANTAQRNNFEIIKGYALHWEELGEDLSVAGFFENQETAKNILSATYP